MGVIHLFECFWTIVFCRIIFISLTPTLSMTSVLLDHEGDGLCVISFLFYVNGLLPLLVPLSHFRRFVWDDGSLSITFGIAFSFPSLWDTVLYPLLLVLLSHFRRFTVLYPGMGASIRAGMGASIRGICLAGDNYHNRRSFYLSHRLMFTLTLLAMTDWHTSVSLISALSFGHKTPQCIRCSYAFVWMPCSYVHGRSHCAL